MKNRIEHAIILAAGLGTRIKPITDHAPKCLTEVNRTPILVNTLANISTIGIPHCTIVTGYLSEMIFRKIGSNFKGVSVNYIQNDIYASTNDMYSLWLARDTLGEGAIIFECDVFIKSETLSSAFSSMGERSYYIAGKYNGKPDEVMIKTDPAFQIRSIDVLRGKEGSPGSLTFMSSGILVVQAEYGKQFSGWLGEWVRENRVTVLFDDVLAQYVKHYPLWVYEIGWDNWVEIDTDQDLKRAEALFK